MIHVLRYQLFLLTLILSGVPNRTSGADDASKPKPTDAEIAFFETKIRPVLVKHCYECHADGTAEGELQLHSRAAIRRGGTRGAAVVPGRPEASLLLTAISHRDADLKMPPKGSKLPDQVIADVRRWIETGAADPRAGPVDPAPQPWAGMEAAKTHWAYQPVANVEPPSVADPSWPRGDIDHFVLATLTKHGMQPSPDSEPRTLLRRLHFDLIGLPPTPQSTESFLRSVEAEGLDTALAGEVDRLLGLPQYGERWGRHWLDVARFGESSGGESNISFPYAWRYRDYVIDAINADIPYNQFLTEQIAGDLLEYKDDAERARLLIATGFLAVGTKNLGEGNDKKFAAEIIDEQIDSMSRSVIASSIACARCHHHKFDPFTMEDYYGLAGIFASSKTYFGTFVSPASRQGGDPLVLPSVAGQKIFHRSLSPKKFAELKAKHAELLAERNAIDEANRARLAGKKPKKEYTLREVLANIWRLGPVEGKLETLDDNGNALPVTMGVLDAEVVDVPLLARGEVGREGEIVSRAFPKAISVTDARPIPSHQSGRLELAAWMSSPQNPLTGRVIVNRVWKHLFDRGLVASVDNFGTTGDKPSHPELLDHLARRFTDQGWSLKQLIRSIVLSRTYRQSSAFDAGTFDQDPENRWLWRMPKRRLEAEAIRDAMLAICGSLDDERPDGSLVAKVIGDKPISLIGLDKRLPFDLDGASYRSVYLPVIRDRLPDVLELFDFAEPGLVTGRRETTNVPSQALYLMNSDFMYDRSVELTARLVNETKTKEEFVQRAFLLCFTRLPEEPEMTRAIKFLNKKEHSPEIRHGDLAQISFCQAVLSTAEFRILD